MDKPQTVRRSLMHNAVLPTSTPKALIALFRQFFLSQVFVLGGPGAGKGTQCQLLAQEFSIPHISAGDCLREEQANPNSPYSKLIDDCIRNGRIVPVRITLTLLLRKMLLAGFNGTFLIDGFPRNTDNLAGWLSMTSSENLPSELSRIATEFSAEAPLVEQCQSVLQKLGHDSLSSVPPADRNKAVPDLTLGELGQQLTVHPSAFGIIPRLVLFFECDEEEMIRRILKRGATSGRTDDNVESLRKRFSTFRESTMPIVSLFAATNCAVTINANQPIPRVWEDVKAAFEPIATSTEQDASKVTAC
ncbi:putative UMP-CMP kinase [Cyclospora cayetanensis]|uniref:UMP-CMP kinase n=1 Tax=Cyclospora cayetanensis TaxID=88456 RepID=A0A1D3D4S5_9EIME|nr:putative UMP-CMP kinase [Cyclospora cayetanensis]